MRSTIDSLIKLPLQIPFETSVRSKREVDAENLIIKSGHRKEASGRMDDSDKDAGQLETPAYSKGYIKCPRYDFF